MSHIDVNPTAVEAELADGYDRPVLPKYPVHVLDGALLDLIESTSLPAALVAGGGLAALAVACAPAVLRIYQDVVRPVLWVPLIGPVSAGKTPAQNYAFEALRELDSSTYDLLRRERDNWKINKKENPRPLDRTRLIQDVTIEKMATLLDDNPFRGQVHDELAALIKAIGQYKRGGGSDRDKWLELWSGSAWRYSRVRDDIDILIQHPVLSVCGTLQTSRLDLLGTDGADGFRARWLPHATDKQAAEWTDTVGRPDLWVKTIEGLYDRTEPREWCLRGKALQLWQEAGKRWKAEARAGAERPLAVDALGKADQQAARIALVLAESESPGAGGGIPADVMEAAITVTDYIMDIWRWMEPLEKLSKSRAEDEIWRAVCAWRARAAQAEGGRVKLRSLQQGYVGGVRNKQEVQEVLEAYRRFYPDDVRVSKPQRGPDTTWVHG